mmetsp:Transcript_26144/g.34932  ORF Transcript_26144/g.34932 Transcript_26144/m.34932 type:complete len:125 (+) Transcript_26144:863-1237(+)|eukprot:CAMPEP_0185620432 /NCGR_PEP_ID=MMETSP0436-20130131/54018_1 /TAXON_ID=626734 ORGANISM="Favella taraikaensis, Strain Fe Narragansett Bay" /NCGR_SAMPLE_ID=MMETSP0436 /ASSEMBLY_ACC=CAM_ASM_000390 /LENGTH=124 /DNA_ID=CAMNT_0028260827 /DNA_START=279 /DNA_END=653 /DNA_ORIENTATION=-
MYDNTLAQKKAKWKAYRAQRFEGQEMVREELDKAEDKQKSAIAINCMQGEDYMSRARENLDKIDELKQIIVFLKAEPTVWKERYMRLLTQLRRETERKNMAMEDRRLEIVSLKKTIEGRDQRIA